MQNSQAALWGFDGQCLSWTDFQRLGEAQLKQLEHLDLSQRIGYLCQAVKGQWTAAQIAVFQVSGQDA
jgi:hypothetical protein